MLDGIIPDILLYVGHAKNQHGKIIFNKQSSGKEGKRKSSNYKSQDFKTG